MPKKYDDTEGVPVRLDSTPDHRKDGVAVAVPPIVSDTEPKSGHKAASNEEK